MRPDLAAAVTELYAVFARHPLAERIGYCDHCVGEDEALVLQRTPLRRLTAEQLARYTFKAMSTWGDEADFRHFLPRILELFANGELPDGHLLGKTLNEIRHHAVTWPVDETDAVEQYLVALWRHVIATPGGWLRPAELLNGSGANDHSVERYLRLWDEDPSDAATLQLAQLVDDHCYWPLSPSCYYHREVALWLDGGAPTRRLEAAFAATTDPDTANLLGQALELLEFRTLRDDDRP